MAKREAEDAWGGSQRCDGPRAGTEIGPGKASPCLPKKQQQINLCFSTMNKRTYPTLQDAITAQLEVLNRYGEMQSIYKDETGYHLTSRRAGESRYQHRLRKHQGHKHNLHTVNLV